MIPITPTLPPYLPPYVPVSNITPFTYGDGVSYVEKLEGMQTEINEIVTFVNTNFTGLGDAFADSVNELITEVNTALETQTANVNAALDAQSEAVTAQIAALESNNQEAIDAANIALDAANAAVDHANAITVTLTEQVLEQVEGVNASLAAMTTYVDEQVALIQDNSLEANDPVVAALISDLDSATRVALDALYSISSIGDEEMSSIIGDIDSDTRTLLDSLYNTGVTPDEIDTIVAALVADDDSSTQAALDIRYTPPIIANLDASVITTGVFSAARIPNLENLNGTLTLAKGGTGGTDKATARTSLGFTDGSAVPAGGANGDWYAQVLP